MLKSNICKIALVGTPNAGKTTLFNSLTGENAKVGNWHGVTTESELGKFDFKGKSFEVVDLPGLYAINGSIAEERVTENYLKDKKYDIIVVVVECKRFKKSIPLIEDLKRLNKPIIVLLNLYADFLRKGGKIDLNKTERFLGVEVVVGEATDKNTATELKNKFIQGVSLPKKSERKLSFYTPQKFNYKLSAFLFGKFTAIPVFFAITLFTLWFSFGNYSPINIISNAISRLFDDKLIGMVNGQLKKLCSPFIAGLVSDGIMSGISSVLVFIPQVCALGLCIDVLDLSGYLSGFSAVADDLLGKFGLSGKALYTLFGGFGCTAMALSYSDGIDDIGVKKRVVLSLPFISCSAKTPVYLYFASALFKTESFTVICIVWILSVVFSLLHSLLLKKTVIKNPTENYIAEIADLRLPKVKTLLKSLQKRAIQFIIKLASIVLILSAVLWILKNISLKMEFLDGERIEDSLLAFIGKPLRFLFYPIGVTDWRFSVALFSGVFAKEGVASTLAVLFGKTVNLSMAQGIALTVFCFAYTPCLTALSAMKQKMGLKFAIICAVYQLIAALLLCYVSYFLFNSAI